MNGLRRLKNPPMILFTTNQILGPILIYLQSCKEILAIKRFQKRLMS